MEFTKYICRIRLKPAFSSVYNWSTWLPLFSWLSCFSPYGAAAKGQILAGKTRAGGRKIPKIRYGKIICPRTGVLRQGTETGKC